MSSVSALPLHTLVQPRAQGGAAPKATLACFPLETWPRSEYWCMMLQSRNCSLTSLPQPFSYLLCALGTAGKITAHIISSLEIVPEQAHVCALVLLATHLAEGSHMTVSNSVCITFWKRISFSLAFCLFPVKRKSLLLFFHLIWPAFLPTLFDFRVLDLDVNGLLLTFISSLQEISMRKSRTQMCLLLAAGI